MTLQGDWQEESKANAVTNILGYDENGNTRQSAIPVFLDEWFHGDFKTEQPLSLSSALGSKSLEEYPDEYPDYRINSVVEIGFDTDGETIADTDYEVQITDPDDPDTSGGLSPVTLEGGVDEPDNPFRNQFDHYDDDQDDDYLPATQKGPHSKNEKVSVPREDGTDIDGIRGSIIFGGSDKYLEKLKSDIETLTEITDNHVPAAISRFFVHLHPFYTFLDFAFMADGAKAVRIWDASPYPAHSLYVDEEWQDQNKFREDIDWTVDGSFQEDIAFVKFAAEGFAPGITPFSQGGSFGYRTLYASGTDDHPVMRHFEPGSSLTVENLINGLDNPLFPDNIDNPI